MSGEADTIRRSTEAYSRGDLDGFLEGYAPDAVIDWSNSRGPDAAVYRGRDEIRGFAERFRGTFEDVTIELIDGPNEVGDGVWFAANVTRMRGRDGIEVEARSAWLIEFRDGKQTSLTMYQTKADALDAAGRRD